MKVLLLSLLLLALVTTAAERPNVVFILVDDLGWSDLGCYGSTFHETPYIDRLASEGVRFTDAYAANPVCSPTRASIMTGKYPSRIKLTNHSGIAGPGGPTYKLIAPQPIGSLPLDEVTIAEALRDAGYQTAHVGKWHLQAHSQKDKKHFPEAHGFQVNIAGHNAGQPGSFFYPYTHPKHTWSDVPGLEPGQDEEYLTDRLTDEAIRFIDDNREQPFFLNLWYYSVHTPIQAKPDKIAKYRAKAAKLPPLAEPGIPEHDSWHHARQDNPVYAAMLESLDENVGRLLTALQERGLDRRTIVMFMSDNGGLSTGTSKNAPTSCLPLRAGKGWVYEGGIRSPLLVKWPATTTPGATCEQPVISTDVYPTLLTMAGLPQRPTQHLDGIDLSPVLRSSQTTLNREAIYFHYPHYHHINSMGPSGAVRSGDYKLVERFETMTNELYNVRQDPGEQHDLSKTKPEVAARLRTLLHQWRAQSGAEMPTRNRDTEGAEFYTPKADLDALKASTPLKADLPNVLLIGDSISIAYTPEVTSLLEGTANVQRIRGNSGDTNRGRKALTTWLGDTKWDLIHFNWGLHDLCYRHPDAKVYGKRDKINGTISVPLPKYRRNLQTIVKQLKKTGATLVWASTTIVPEDEAGRHPQDAPRYNSVAAEVMAQHGIPSNDLFAESAAFPPELFSKPGDVHFSKAGSSRLAARVAAAIEKELAK